MKNTVLNYLKKALQNKNWDVVKPEINFSEKKEFGDYFSNIALKLRDVLRKNPIEIANELKKEVLNLSPSHFFKKIEVAPPGFLNFFVNQKVILEEFNKISKNKNLGIKKEGKNKKIIFEYSNPNIAKKMHVGHLRGTIIGDALANIYQILGYKVIRWNYLGDWGTQFGNLIAGWKMWGKKENLKKQPIDTLLKIYIRFHKEMKKNPKLKKMGQEEFKKLELGDRENRNLWKMFCRYSILEFKKIYKILDVKFDVWIGESFYEKDIPKIIKILTNKKLTQESRGAIIIPLEKFNLPPALILKSDEASLYLTRDVANLLFRIKKFKPHKIIYVVGNEQTLHFNQLFAIAELLGINRQKLIHLKYGLVLNENKKRIKTREGEFIALEEVLNKAKQLAFNIVNKNKKLSFNEKQKIAQIIGIGAIKYNDLKEHRHQDIIFNWKKMLDIFGQSAPYIQYAYTRIKSIIKKSGTKKIELKDINHLNSEVEIELIKNVIQFPEIINLCAQNYLTSYLANYLYKISSLFNKFYETIPVLNEKNEVIKKERLILIQFLSQILKTGLNILGIKTTEKM